MTTNIYLPLVMRQPTVAAASAPAAVTSAPAAPLVDALRFGDNQTTPRHYLAQSPARRLTPLSITLDQPSNLQATSPGADYIIITHADFKTAIQPLADFRASQSLRVRVVDVQDIYDEFGGGLMSAEAIHDFIAYAYNNWAKPAPKSILLVGDGTYDLRHYRYAAPTFIPPYLAMVDPTTGETATDNRFVTVTPGDILPDLDIGRLPANDAAEATVMVNKILAYEAQASAAWMKQVLFVADNQTLGGGNFYTYSDGIAALLPAGYTPNKIYRNDPVVTGGNCDLAVCRPQIIDRISAGSLIVSYIGHGQKTFWATDTATGMHLYDATALGQLTNTGKLTIMLPMTCNEGYFIDPDPAYVSLSEQGVRIADRGVIASWAPTGYGIAPGHDYLERGIFMAIFQDGKTLGSAATAAKLYMVSQAPGQYLDLIDTFLLLGDPALRVPQ